MRSSTIAVEHDPRGRLEHQGAALRVEALISGHKKLRAQGCTFAVILVPP
ncbi:MAG TPA: hypothetical protein VMF65_13535 [Acidimicrobiales bacterium]|nr:hypothetical protein [Acidimicrobiales bacterium]